MNNAFYRTTDFYLAAYLYAQGFPLEDIEGIPGERRKNIVFSQDAKGMTAKAESIANEYYARRCLVEPTSFAFAIK